MVLKYYYDLMSQPSRALYIFLKLTKIPFEACPVALRKGVHLTDEFKENYSKFQKVPFIHDGNFRLTESVGIFRYLTREYPVEDHWYPKDSKQQAKVDEYLEYQHLNVRWFCGWYFQHKVVIPRLTGAQLPPEEIQKYEHDMINCLDQFEELFLSDTPFINGFSKITFADILAACEIEQPRMAGYDPTKGRPKLEAWLQRVRNECKPYYSEAHQVVHAIIERTKREAQAKL